MDSDVERFEEEILRQDLLPARQTVLLAVSGGADSMVLLDLLVCLSPKYQWSLTVAHLNHQLRGEESDLDEAWVRETAQDYGLPCVVRRERVWQRKEAVKCSLEHAARLARHEFLARAALELSQEGLERGCPTRPLIVLAHHADDQVELFFIRLLRGAGSVGLAGMDWRSPSPVDPRFQLVRPLLGMSKAWILNYAQRHGIQFRHDSSNFQTDILRNRIRRELIPNLRDRYQPGLAGSILKTMEILRAESDFIGLAAEKWLARQDPQEERSSPAKMAQRQAQEADAFERLHRSLQRRILQKQLHQLGLQPGYDLIENLRFQPGRPYMVAPRRAVWRDTYGLIHFIQTASPAVSSQPVVIDLGQAAGESQFGDLKIRWEILPRAAWSISCFNKETRIEYFDLEKIGAKAVVRNWVPGDRFQPIGMKVAVKLQDLFVNAKVPEQERHIRALGQAGDGSLFWVEGLRIGERGKVTEETRTLLKWSWDRVSEGNK